MRKKVYRGFADFQYLMKHVGHYALSALPGITARKKGKDLDFSPPDQRRTNTLHRTRNEQLYVLVGFPRYPGCGRVTGWVRGRHRPHEVAFLNENVKDDATDRWIWGLPSRICSTIHFRRELKWPHFER